MEFISEHEIIANSYIELHQSISTQKEENQEQNQTLWDHQAFQFATLTLEIADTPPIQTQQLIHFNIDMSGSMSDPCHDKRTKMQHIIHTTKNIISLFSKNTNTNKNTDTNIYVEIYGFDDGVETIVPKTKCNATTFQQIIDELEYKLHPRGSTNVEKALAHAHHCLEQDQDPTQPQETQPIKRTHVFMTDGEITLGETNPFILANMVDTSYPNIFIGFGIDHDATLLQTLSNHSNSNAYYNIDNIETAGLAYGEIVHSILYQALENITITINNGEIYDYRTNSWSNQLHIPSLVGEAKKKYHLRIPLSTQEQHLCAEIRALSSQTQQRITDHVTVLPYLENAPPNDLTKYLYRQRTLELLYEVQQNNTPITQTRIKKQAQYEKLQAFLQNMKQYMEESGTTECNMMKTLCDDIGITMSALKTRKQNVIAAYSLGRARSNGTQGAYQPRTLPRHQTHLPKPSPLLRQKTQTFSQWFDEFQNDFQDQHKQDQQDNDDDGGFYEPLTPTLSREHTTQRQLSVIRTLIGDDDETPTLSLNI